MKAVILAGGKGTRLLPLTKDIPKPMVKISNRPLLEWQVLVLKKYGIKELVLCTNYLHDAIENHFKDGKDFGVQIEYSREQEELGTAGAVKLAEKYLGNEDFFVLFGDEMLHINLLQMARYHEKKGAETTVLVHEAKHPLDCDLVELDHNNKIKKIFRPQAGDIFRPVNLSCVYILKPNILKKIPLAFCDFGKQIFPKMLEQGAAVQGYLTEEYVKDIGTHERLQEVEEDLKNGYIFGFPNELGEYL